MDLWDYARDGKLCVRAIPNASKTEIQGWDAEKRQLRVRICAPTDKGKANSELASFLSKLLGKKAVIVKGLRSRDKVFRVS